MKKTELQDRLSIISRRAAEQNKGALGEAAMIFEELSGEARRRAEIEREDNRRRSPFVKFLFVLTLVSAFSAVAVGIYGIYNFPDAPLRQKGDVYAGKHGQPRTREDYERFLKWQTALFASFGSTFFLAFVSAIADSREKRRRNELSE